MRDGASGDAPLSGSDVAPAPPISLNTAVHRRRADQAFFLRLAGAIAQNERALMRLRT
jgi:hypothetical protein